MELRTASNVNKLSLTQLRVADPHFQRATRRDATPRRRSRVRVVSRPDLALTRSERGPSLARPVARHRGKRHLNFRDVGSRFPARMARGGVRSGTVPRNNIIEMRLINIVKRERNRAG